MRAVLLILVVAATAAGCAKKSADQDRASQPAADKPLTGAGSAPEPVPPPMPQPATPPLDVAAPSDAGVDAPGDAHPAVHASSPRPSTEAPVDGDKAVPNSVGGAITPATPSSPVKVERKLDPATGKPKVYEDPCAGGQ